MYVYVYVYVYIYICICIYIFIRATNIDMYQYILRILNITHNKTFVQNVLRISLP